MVHFTSTYADEGTLAHECAAAVLSAKLGELNEPGLTAILNKCQENELWSDDIYTHASNYVSVVEQYLTSWSAVSVEHKVDLNEYLPGCWGTVDCAIDNGEELVIIDFKYGRGVRVSATANEQMMIYALGMLTQYTERVTCVIYQPRIFAVPDVSQMNAKPLREWGEKTVKASALKALVGEGELSPSEKSCKFCRAKPVCRALADKVFEDAKIDTPPQAMTPIEAANALTKAALIKSWLTAVEDYVKGQLLSGNKLDGWKLVEGRSTRKIVNPQAATERLIAAGFPIEMTHKMTLFGITDLEKLVGKKALPDILGDSLVKPAGAPTMVTSDDDRPEMVTDAGVLEAFGKVNY